MLKKLNVTLNISIFSLFGIMIGQSIKTYLDYRTHPALYEIQSAPWYTSIMVDALFTVSCLGLLLLIKYFIKKHMKP